MKKLKEWEREQLEKFQAENSELLQNDLVISFLKSPLNQEVYKEAIINPTPENKQKLDMRFKQFYFKIRFISHISTTLKFNSINYDKRQRLLKSRFPAILDAPLNSEEGEGTTLDVIANEATFNSSMDLYLSDDIIDHVSHQLLYEALQTLTDKQKQIINMVYIKGLSDTEISFLLNKSQQAISKTHKRALANIKKYIETHAKGENEWK